MNDKYMYTYGSLRQMLVEGGYVTFTGTVPVYHFYIQDHLGNNRVVARADGTVEQVNHYYPYGGLRADICTGSDVQRYKYNGKELDRMHGLDWHDYGARHYDANTGRWPTMDLLAEENPEVSPYVYCRNYPMKFIDPDGKKVWVYAIELPFFRSISKYPNITPTHTFVVVQMSNGKVRRFEYCPQGNSIIHAITGLSILQQCYYAESGNAVKNYMTGIKDNTVKDVIEVNVPDDMTSDEFDRNVIKSADIFKNNSEIKYRMIPLDNTEGNCNTSTTSLLKNAGVPDKEIKRIDSEIDGIKTGFGTYKP